MLGLGGGGFHLEMERLLARMSGNLELVLVYTIESQTTGNWNSPFPVHRVFVVRSPALYQDSRWKQAWAMLTGVWRALWILLACQPDCIIALGTAQVVPFGLISRLLGIPLLFVESITRVQRPSLTGKLVSRLRLATRHYVQWENLARQDRRTIFMGSVFK